MCGRLFKLASESSWQDCSGLWWYFYFLVYKIFQTYLVLLLQIIFSGEWYLETIVQVLGVLIVSGLVIAQWAGLGKYTYVCRYVGTCLCICVYMWSMWHALYLMYANIFISFLLEKKVEYYSSAPCILHLILFFTDHSGAI